MTDVKQNTEDKVAKPEPCRQSRREIEEFAELISKKLDIGPDVSEESIVKLFGGKLQRVSDMQEFQIGSIRISDERDFEIKLPEFESALSDRFTVAHEIGHYLLHYLFQKHSIGKPIGNMVALRYLDESDKNAELSEKEADWFAASLIMPAEKFKACWKKFGSAVEVALYFKVSLSEAISRAERLGLT